MTGFRNLMTGAAGAAGAGGFAVDNSAVFNEASDQYLKKVYTTTGTSNKTITLSLWFKRGRLGANSQGHQQNLIGFQTGAQFLMEITTADKIRILAENNAGGVPIDWTSDLVVRDTHAWYHIMWTLDTTPSTPVNKVWLNGVEVTDWTKTNNTLAQNDAFPFGATTSSLGIATRASYSVQDFDGYLAEVVYLDGQVQTDATNFGEYDTNGVWRPINVSGLTFGTNGFYLPFTASGALGADYGTTRTAPSVSFLTSAYSSSNTSSYTFSSQSLGTAASDRKIYVCVGSSAVSTAYSFSSVTVAGVTATQIVAGNADNNSSFQPFAIYEADVPSGTTGDVVVNLSGTMANCAIALYRATGAGPIIYSDATNGGSFPSPNTVSLVAQASKNSVILSHGNKNGQTVRVTLAGVTEEYDFGGESDMAIFGGINTSATSSDAVGVTTSATVDSGSASYLGIATIVIGGVGDTSLKEVNSPTQTSDSPTSNFCTFSPLYPQSGTLSNGNRTAVDANTNPGSNEIGSMATGTSGKYYVEFTYVNDNGFASCGFFQASGSDVEWPGGEPTDSTRMLGGIGWQEWTGKIRRNNSDAHAGSTYTSGDILGFYLDFDNDAIWCSKNGTLENGASQAEVVAGTTTNAILTGTLATDGALIPYAGCVGGTNTTFTLNTGQSAFNTALYTGYTGLSAKDVATSNTPAIEDGSAYFQATTYTGNGSSKEVNQSGNSTFQPDFVWIKDRGGAHHAMIDAVRGANKGVRSSLNFIEYTESNLSFDTDGFSMTSAGSAATINTSSNNYVAWQWKGGNGTSSNTDGRKASDASVITSTVSLNQTAGFSIVRWTGNGSTSTIGHGLNAKPNMILIKNLDTVDNWVVYHDDVGFNAITLNSTGQRITTGASVYWNDTAHTSSIFNVNTHGGVNGDTNDMIAYCFTSIPGYSRFGAYEGNDAADGPYVHLGFKPAFLMVKNIDASGGWPMYDNARTPNNPSDKNLNADQNASEYSPDYTFDLLSNGFKIRDAQAYVNDANSYLYMAFAEHPFAGTTPATAR